MMKRIITLVAFPVTLIAGWLTASPGKHSATNITTAVLFAPDTLRPDPICNMKVDDTKGDTIHYKGHIFGFCSKYCRAKFEKDPDSYLPKKKD